MEITILMQLLSASFVAGITWLLSRTKGKAEVAKMKEETAQAYLDNVESAVQLWKGIAKELETQVRNLTTEVKMLRKENQLLQKSYEDLKRTIDQKVN